MAKVVLYNKGRQRVDISLYHHIFCRYHGECWCKSTERIGPKGKLVIDQLAASITILSRDKSDELPSAVLHLPQVKELIRRRMLVRFDVPSADLPDSAVAGPPVLFGGMPAPGRVIMQPVSLSKPASLPKPADKSGKRSSK